MWSPLVPVDRASRALKGPTQAHKELLQRMADGHEQPTMNGDAAPATSAPAPAPAPATAAAAHPPPSHPRQSPALSSVSRICSAAGRVGIAY